MLFYFSLKWDRLVSNLLVIKVHQGLIGLLTLLLHAVDCPGNGPDSIIGIAMISETMWLCKTKTYTTTQKSAQMIGWTAEYVCFCFKYRRKQKTKLK